jgi:hypothetical protein
MRTAKWTAIRGATVSRSGLCQRMWLILVNKGSVTWLRNVAKEQDASSRIIHIAFLSFVPYLLFLPGFIPFTFIRWFSSHLLF